jgi:hypothetical protein
MRLVWFTVRFHLSSHPEKQIATSECINASGNVVVLLFWTDTCNHRQVKCNYVGSYDI